jgi:hypothetical protein
MVHRKCPKKSWEKEKKCSAIFLRYIRWSGFVVDLYGEPGRGTGFGIHVPSGAWHGSSNMSID